MNNKIYECAIIGGGLAGLTLAIQLSEKGKSVILFEKEQFPFHKVCGEYISMESFNFLERLGVPLSVMDLPRITNLLVSAPNGNFLERPLGLGGFGISRFTLDKLLADIAISRGVEVRDNTKVIDVCFKNGIFLINTDHEIIKAKVACGTHGKRSVIDAKLKRNFFTSKSDSSPNYIAVKYHINLPFPDNRIELHNFNDGYCGISKVDNDRYCLCYLTTSDNLKNNGNSIKNMEASILMQNPFLKKYFSESEFLYEKPLVISQIGFKSKTAVEQHVLMIGDAAGTIAPLCGNGMSMAMKGSYFAGNIILNFLEGKIKRIEMEVEYSKLWKDEFDFRIRTGSLLQSSFGKEILTNFTIGILKKFPALTDKLISLTHGKPF